MIGVATARDVPETGLNPLARSRRSLRPIRFCIWTYLILWIFEGALRKWAFPELSNPLGLIREPFVAAAYLLAFRAGVFPRNGFVWVSAILCAALLGIGYFLIGLPIGVMAAGVWAYFWPIPFLFLIARVMDAEDVHRIAKFLLVTAVPMALLMAVQFRSPAGSRINAMVGQEEFVETWSVKEVAGEVRPSGTWSYVGGASAFFMLVAGILFAYMADRKRTSTLLWSSAAGALALSTLVSHSRTQVYGVGLVAILFLLLGWSQLTKRLNRAVSGAVLIGLAASVLLTTRIGQQGFEVLERRFTEASKAESLAQRLRYNLLPSEDQLTGLPLWGYGLGVGTNTGAIFLIGRRAFLLAEAETPRIIMEMGLPLGLLYGVGIRYGLIVLMGLAAWRSVGKGNLMPLAWFAASFPSVATGSWGTPPIQAFSVLCAGLCLAAAKARLM
ncbi:MAG: hypothetical protein N2109_12435 [Fimbriimonadales bacterium]|nr:hypothetical protein [Fimbriimonadales bacterium]